MRKLSRADGEMHNLEVPQQTPRCAKVVHSIVSAPNYGTKKHPKLAFVPGGTPCFAVWTTANSPFPFFRCRGVLNESCRAGKLSFAGSSATWTVSYCFGKRPIDRRYSIALSGSLKFDPRLLPVHSSIRTVCAMSLHLFRSLLVLPDSMVQIVKIFDQLLIRSYIGESLARVSTEFMRKCTADAS